MWWQSIKFSTLCWLVQSGRHCLTRLICALCCPMISALRSCGCCEEKTARAPSAGLFWQREVVQLFIGTNNIWLWKSVSLRFRSFPPPKTEWKGPQPPRMWFSSTTRISMSLSSHFRSHCADFRHEPDTSIECDDIIWQYLTHLYLRRKPEIIFLCSWCSQVKVLAQATRPLDCPHFNESCLGFHVLPFCSPIFFFGPDLLEAYCVDILQRPSDTDTVFW